MWKTAWWLDFLANNTDFAAKAQFPTDIDAVIDSIQPHVADVFSKYWANHECGDREGENKFSSLDNLSIMCNIIMNFINLLYIMFHTQ